MSIDSTQALGAATPAQTGAVDPSTRANSLGSDAFLKLLVVQLQNQDPTNPMDTSQYMSQFAQLSSVEQAMQTNTKLDSLLSSQSLSQAVSDLASVLLRFSSTSCGRTST